MTDDAAWPLAQHVCRTGYADSPATVPASSNLLAGKIQGILFVWASECDYRLAIKSQIQWLTTQFPTHRNREFISP